MNSHLTFRTVEFSVIDHKGQTWLTGVQIAQALGYSREDKVGRLHQRHAHEFTDEMTAVVELPSHSPRSGGHGRGYRVRIFSLRGAYLLGMFARTPKAEAFRRWVLNVLEGVTHAPADLHARLLAAEREEAKSFAQASNAARTLSLRRRAKPILLEAVTRARAEVQMVLALEGGAA